MTFGGSKIEKIAGIRYIRMVILISLGSLLMIGNVAGVQQPKEAKRVLMLFSGQKDLPGQILAEEGMRASLQQSKDFKFEYFIEYLDRYRFSDVSYRKSMLDLFRTKYGDKKIDLFLPEGYHALEFATAHGDEILPQTPVVFATILEKQVKRLKLDQRFTGSLVQIDFSGLLNIALNIHPDTRHVVIIAGASKLGRSIEELTRVVYKSYEYRYDFIYLGHLAMGDMLGRLQKLPEHTVVLYFLLAKDGKGDTFKPWNVTKMVSDAANAPVYGMAETYLGHGIVGGALLSTEASGRKAGEIGLRILEGENLADIPISAEGTILNMFDWRQLKRWGIHERNLPEGSIVHYKERSFWYLYRWYVIGGIFIFLFQLGFITALLAQRRKRRQTQAHLRGSEERYRVFVNNSTEGIWRVEFEVPIDVDLPEEKQFKLVVKHAYIAEANDAYARSVGFDSGDKIIGTRFEEFIPLSEQKNIDTLKAWIRGQYSILNAETIESHKDGITRVFLNNASAVIEDGRVVTVWGTHTDITELKIAEKNLRIAEQKYRTVADFTYDWEYWMAPEGHMLYVSPSCERISGYSASAFIEDPELLERTILPEDRQIWIEHQIESGINTVSAQEIQFRIRMRNGEVRWIEHVRQPVHSPDGEFLGVRASNRDITKRKLAEEILDMSRKFNYAVLMSMKDHIAVLDKAGYILTVNTSWLDFARKNDVSSPELVGEGINYLDACRRVSDDSDESAQKALDGIKSVLNGWQNIFELEYPCHSPTEQRWYFMRVIPFKGERGGAVVSHADISDRKKAENELKAKETMLEEAQRIAHLGSWNWNIMTDELSWSDEIFRIFGISAQEFGATYEYFLERIHPDDLEDVKETIKCALDDPSMNYNLRHRITTPNGKERIVRARGKVTLDDQGKASRMTGTLQDVTDITQMEMEANKLKAELSHLDRVSSMGVLTAGIAHEINQPLTAILSNAQAAIRFLKKEPQDIEEVKNALQDIISDGKRSGEMVHSIRNIMKRYEPKHQEIDFNETVRVVLMLLKSEALNRKVLLSQKLHPDIPPVYADRIEIQQVALNLLTNALEAISGQQISNPELTVSTQFKDNKDVILSVSDSGPGIEPSRIDSIFDAFETTKKGGLGIGLSICRSIADLHGGQIWAENRPEGGAIFFFSLPLRTANDE
jgi:PAS domain S-box-containing protein